MREIVFEIHRAAEGGFWAEAVGYVIFTQAESLDELEAMIRDAVDCHFEPGEQRPEAICWRFDEAETAA
jgi:predicted RNase H-like HicB family nuclease